MKKLFGRDKPKPTKVTPLIEDSFSTTPIHQQHAHFAVSSRKPSIDRDDDRWEQPPTPSREPSLVSLPPGVPLPVPSPLPRSGSPAMMKERERETLRERDPMALSQYASVPQQVLVKKKPAPGAGGAAAILSALEPPRVVDTSLAPQPAMSVRSAASHEVMHDAVVPEAKKEKKGFWERVAGGDRDKDRDREKEKERERERERERDRERDLHLQRDHDSQAQLQVQQREREPHRDREYAHKEKDRSHTHALPTSRRDDDGSPELTRMIGFLTATASEDWSLVLDVCERASASEANAKEAVRALRREFRYGEPSAQLSAARLWAILLRNSSQHFISQSMSRKFLDTLEDLLTSSRTSPVVRERVLNVLGAAAYASGGAERERERERERNGDRMPSGDRDKDRPRKDGHKGDRDGFRGLWRRVKPADKPEEGMPLDTDDSMFNPPAPGGRSSFSHPHSQPPHSPPPHGLPDDNRARALPPSNTPIGTITPFTLAQTPHPPPKSQAPTQDRPSTPNGAVVPPSTNTHTHPRKPKSVPRNRIIPVEEDMRRLMQECKIGHGNAELLSQALVFAKPEDLKKDIIREFYVKCSSSQELICTQIPWATASAERSREAKMAELMKLNPNHKQRTQAPSQDGRHGSETPDLQRPGLELTPEEALLEALLSANGELMEVMKQYDDMERVGLEREAEDRSRREVRMDPRQRQQLEANELYGRDGSQMATGGSSRPRSRSPSPSSTAASNHTHGLPAVPQVGNVANSYNPDVLPNPYGNHASSQHSLGMYSSNPDLVFGGAAPAMHPSHNHNLAPPPAAPQGPRSPIPPSLHSSQSRSPSPSTPAQEGQVGHPGLMAVPPPGQGAGYENTRAVQGGYATSQAYSYSSSASYGSAYRESPVSGDEHGNDPPAKPSEKALGKRRVMEPEEDRPFDPDDLFYADQKGDQTPGIEERLLDSDRDDDASVDWNAGGGARSAEGALRWGHTPTRYVYDAAAERTKERLKQSQALVNGVH